MQKSNDKKSVNAEYIFSWVICAFCVTITLLLFKASALSGVTMLAGTFLCSPFTFKKITANGKISQAMVAVIQLFIMLTFIIISFALGIQKNTESSQQQIIAEETTTEATEQPTEPTTETEPETIPETTKTATEVNTEPETEGPTTEQVTESETIPIELDSLQNLFVSLKSDTTRDEIDRYIVNNGLIKSAFTGNETYYIGYENRAVLQREIDRIGNAIDINFFTSGNTDLIGKVKSAKYKLHDSAYISKYTLIFQDDCFYLETSGEKKAYENGKEAMQEYLTDLMAIVEE